MSFWMVDFVLHKKILRFQKRIKGILKGVYSVFKITLNIFITLAL